MDNLPSATVASLLLTNGLEVAAAIQLQSTRYLGTMQPNDRMHLHARSLISAVAVNTGIVLL